MNKLYACYCRGYQAAFRVATKVLDWTGPRLIQGAGSVKKLPSVIKADGFDNVLIVTDKVLHGLGLLDGLKAGSNTVIIEAANTPLRDTLNYGGADPDHGTSILEPSGMFGKVSLVELA